MHLTVYLNDARERATAIQILTTFSDDQPVISPATADADILAAAVNTRRVSTRCARRTRRRSTPRSGRSQHDGSTHRPQSGCRTGRQRHAVAC